MSANFSIPTLDEKAWRASEPRTPNPRARLEAVAELNRAGIPTGVLVAPLMPGINDSPRQVEAVLEAVAEAGATGVSGIGLHLRGETRGVFMEWLRSYRPDLVERYERLYGRGAYLPDRSSAGFRGCCATGPRGRRRGSRGRRRRSSARSRPGGPSARRWGGEALHRRHFSESPGCVTALTGIRGGGLLTMVGHAIGQENNRTVRDLFATRSHSWREAGPARQLSRKAVKRARIQVFVLLPLLAAVLVFYDQRHRLLDRAWDTPVQIATAVALIILGWADRARRRAVRSGRRCSGGWTRPRPGPSGS